jgi:dihydroflavonol-4-reductase
MRILLTGGTGFIGSHVARQLIGAGHRVRALRRSARTPVGLEAGVEWVPGDLTNAATLTRAVQGVEAVIHVGAAVTFGRPASAEQRLINVEGTRALVAAAAREGARRFVFTSSVAALGHPNGQSAGQGDDEDVPYDWPPGLGYHESKRDSEREAFRGLEHGLEVIAFNPAIVLGPGDAHVGPLLRAIRWRLMPVAPPGGTTLCDVRDVAAAHVAALTRGRSGERYILGGVHVSYRELATHLAQALGAPPPQVVMPMGLLLGLSRALTLADRLLPLPVAPAYLGQFLRYRHYSSDKAARELGYRSRPVEEMARDTVAWYREQGMI